MPEPVVTGPVAGPVAGRQHQRTPAPGRLRRLLPPLLLAGGLLAASVALHLRDPHEPGSWGLCPLRALTGMACPGCGGLRAVNDLTHGDVLAAASSNLLLVASLPVLGWLWLRSTAQRWRGVTQPLPPALTRAAAAGAVVALVLFAVVRNLPGLGWLLP